MHVIKCGTCGYEAHSAEDSHDCVEILHDEIKKLKTRISFMQFGIKLAINKGDTIDPSVGRAYMVEVLEDLKEGKP